MTLTTAKCYSQFKLYQITLYQAVLIFVADVVILIAPMVILCGLNMPTRKIVALMAIFGTGHYPPVNPPSLICTNSMQVLLPVLPLLCVLAHWIIFATAPRISLVRLTDLLTRVLLVAAILTIPYR